MRKLLFILAIIVAFTSCTTVDTNEVGIKYYKWSADENLKGGVVGTARGFTFFNPFTQRISIEKFLSKDTVQGKRVYVDNGDSYSYKTAGVIDLFESIRKSKEYLNSIIDDIYDNKDVNEVYKIF